MGHQRGGQTRKWIFPNDIVAGAGSDWRQRKDGDDHQPPAHIHHGDIGQLAGAMSGLSGCQRVSQHNIYNNFTLRITHWESQAKRWQPSNNKMFPI